MISIVTYGCSAFFIFYLKDIIAAGMPEWLYLAIVLSLGIFWTGLRGWLGATWFIKPLLRLASAANEAAKQVEMIAGATESISNVQRNKPNRPKER